MTTRTDGQHGNLSSLQNAILWLLLSTLFEAMSFLGRAGLMLLTLEAELQTGPGYFISTTPAQQLLKMLVLYASEFTVTSSLL